MDARKSRFAPNTPDPVCAKDTRRLRPTRFAEMVAFKDSLTLDISCPSSLGPSFEVEIQTHVRRIEVQRICSTRRKLGRFTTVVAHTCHTKVMTTLAEYGTGCLYEDTNFYSVLIVRSAS